MQFVRCLCWVNSSSRACLGKVLSMLLTLWDPAKLNHLVVVKSRGFIEQTLGPDQLNHRLRLDSLC
jgi:hypothetical protein